MVLSGVSAGACPGAIVGFDMNRVESIAYNRERRTEDGEAAIDFSLTKLQLYLTEFVVRNE